MEKYRARIRASEANAAPLHKTIRTLIKQRGLFIVDAFKAFNKSSTGNLTCTEFSSAVAWLGYPLEPDAIHAIVRSVDSNNDGLLGVDDFFSFLNLARLCSRVSRFPSGWTNCNERC